MFLFLFKSKILVKLENYTLKSKQKATKSPKVTYFGFLILKIEIFALPLW